MQMQLKLNTEKRTRRPVLEVPIDAVDWNAVLARLCYWGSARESRYVCVCNVHSVVTATQDPDFLRVLEEADLTTPDGAPIAWILRRQGIRTQERINGPDLMWRYLAEAERLGQVVSFYGSTNETLEGLKRTILNAFPQLRLGRVISPPFRPLSEEEDAMQVAEINETGTAVLFVGLGCPKQEKWMAAHRGHIKAVMVGVGAAFDYHAGTIQRAPLWMQQNGLEWSHRLISEPRRLWRRYLVTNSLFVLLAARQLLFRRY
jgi:N-acetylglucosaminyldiphosphoundecaprenol N-acetyl-beta-D-mannosaminyltransferase